jgi:hypothetical protein
MKNVYFAFLLALTFGGLSSAEVMSLPTFVQASPPP